MDIEEMMEIIREEKLYEYKTFLVGPPKGPYKYCAFSISTENQGIFCDEDGKWHLYITERGGVTLSRYEYTEDSACREMIEDMRRKKSIKTKRHRGKIGHSVIRL